MRCSICGVEYRGDGIHACPFTTQYWQRHFPEFGKSMGSVANQYKEWSKPGYFKYDTEQYWRTIIAAEILAGY